jgi:outer membrane protein assembly factor BamB
VQRVLIFAITLILLGAHGGWAQSKSQGKPHFAWGKAYHLLPETHSDESGYFSLCEGTNGKIYVGTAKYGANSFLVEFDPRTEKQRIVIDTHRLCGLNATGYAAQAKIHTRNFVGPSGKIYVGSKQGYRRGPEDKADYPGGYVMTYDPATGRAENLGMPYPGLGVIDVTADEARGLLYVVTCEDQHWMLYDEKTKKYRELGPLLTPYATTLLDGEGKAHAITRGFRLATYDPTTNKVKVRNILVEGKTLGGQDLKLGPANWVLAPGSHSAYLIRMSEPTLFAIPLGVDDQVIQARNLGPMMAGKGFDSRGALYVGTDQKVYAVIRTDNQTGFGTGYLHHLVRYDPKAKKHEDLGVLAVRNPDFFDFRPNLGGKPKP